MKRVLFYTLLITLACASAFSCYAGGVKVSNLRCEMLVNPVGLDVKCPQLSWEVASDVRDVMQQSYRILVASSEQNLEKGASYLWDSGWVKSGESVYIDYKGVQLKSRETYYWKVQVQTNKGKSAWSPVAKWTMGLLDRSEWTAKWTGLDKSFAEDRLKGNTRLAARYLRKEFNSSKEVRKAMLYISGLGLYEAYINGQRIGTQVLSPTPTDYSRSVRYNVFDVTETISAGDNAIGVVLGNGRYFSMREPGVRHFGFPKMIMQLEVEYADGTRQTIVSDNSWKVTANGPIRSNSEFDGEEYDARMEMPYWNKAGYNDKLWLQAELVDAPGGTLEAQANPNIEIMDTHKPVSVKQIKPGVYVMDMGQNMVGWLAMRVKGKAGDQVQLRFAEMIKPDGTLYMDNLRSALVTDKYTLANDKETVWQPSFTYHGFRFVEITGYPGIPTIDDFVGKVIYDKMPVTGKFETSNETINQIYKNAYWGIRGNYRGMPTDCPQRDERMGWLGDRAAGSLGESYVFDNNLLYAKWLQDIEETQLESGSLSDVAPNYWAIYNDDVTWPGAYIIIAQMVYNQYGNKQPIVKHYDSMKKWLDFMRATHMVDNIMMKDTYGDWCMPPESQELIHSQDPARKTDGALLSTSFYYNLLGIMDGFAQLLGRNDDSADFKAQKIAVKEAYNNKFFNADKATYSNNTVTANLLSLAFDLVPPQYAESVFNSMANRTTDEFDSHVSTGLVGIQQLMRGLTHHGRVDVAYSLATNRDYPSWGYMIEQGATTIWELWNGNTADPGMNSANHVMLLGDLIVWYYEDLAGIKNADGSIAFKQITMKPYPVEGLDHVDASYNSVRGQIESSWKKVDGAFDWKITVPANTRATVYVPCKDSDAASIKESGRDARSAKGVKFLKTEKGYAVFEVGSGAYNFKSVY